MLRETISQEFIKFGGNRFLGAELLGVVESIRGRNLPTRQIGRSVVKEITDVITKHTELNLEPLASAGESVAVLQPSLGGHAGVDGRHPHNPTLKGNGKTFRVIDAVVDLERGRIEGAFTLLTAWLVVPRSYLQPDSLFTPEEITALLLHEVGHVFFGLATLGEYAWVNYYLTDGIEVLMGRSPNRYRIELLDSTALTDSVKDQALRDELTTQPTEAAYRRAVLTAYSTDRRHQMRCLRGSVKRDEQLADMFAARHGFARPLATAIYKHAKRSKELHHYFRKKRDASNDGLAVSVGLIAPFLVGWVSPPMGAFLAVGVVWNVASTVWAAGEAEAQSAYDNPMERIEKLRRELIAELRQTQPEPERREIIDSEIQTLDGLLKTMKPHTAILASVAYLVRPRYRRQSQIQKHEELLESLLNNDLFVQANRFRQ